MTSITISPAAEMCIWRTDDVDAAVGEDAAALRRATGAMYHSHGSLSVEGRDFDARVALWTVYEEHSSPNWDGYGAAPASLEAFIKAWYLLPKLPTNAALPDFVVHPDGEIAFEWRSGAGVVTLTLADDSWLKWAALIGGERTYGRLPFSGLLPEKLHSAIVRVSGTGFNNESRRH
jgi:hypothetical protein